MPYVTNTFYDPTTNFIRIDGVDFQYVRDYHLLETAAGPLTYFIGYEPGATYVRAYYDVNPNDNTQGLTPSIGLWVTDLDATTLPDGSVAVLYSETSTVNNQIRYKFIVGGDHPISQFNPSGITVDLFNAPAFGTFSQEPEIVADDLGNILVKVGLNQSAGGDIVRGVFYDQFGNSKTVFEEPIETATAIHARDGGGFFITFVENVNGQTNVILEEYSETGTLQSRAPIHTEASTSRASNMHIEERADGSYVFFGLVGNNVVMKSFVFDQSGLNAIDQLISPSLPKPAPGESELLLDDNGDARAIYHGFGGLSVIHLPKDGGSFGLYTLQTPPNLGGIDGFSVIDIPGTERGFSVTFGNGPGHSTIYYGAGAPLGVINYEQMQDQTNYLGGDGRDFVVGTSRADTIDGQAENDHIRGGLGADVLIGHYDSYVTDYNSGDKIWGGGGNDLIYLDDVQPVTEAFAQSSGMANSLEHAYGGQGSDTLINDVGFSRLHGGDGNDLLIGGDTVDRMRGGNQNDILKGRKGDDLMHGGKGQDLLLGQAGNDELRGGADRDVLRGGLGNDLAFGGLGNDRVYGGEGDDTLLGQSGQDTLEGGLGDDVLTGGGQVDFFVFTGDGATGEVDVITDFNANTDKIVVSGVTGVTSFADISVVSNGTQASIMLGNRMVEINTSASLDQQDFTFV